MLIFWLLADDFDVGVSHVLALGHAVGLDADYRGFDGVEGDGLPDGIVDDVRKLAAGHLGPVGPVGGGVHGVMGHDAIPGL